MFTVDELNSKQYVSICFGTFELPLLFRAALGLHHDMGVSLLMQDGVLWLANPEDCAVTPGVEWAEVDLRGTITLPLEFQNALSLIERDYLILTLHQTERRVSAVAKPNGCIICAETDHKQFTTSDLMCDTCMAKVEEDIQRAREARRVKEETQPDAGPTGVMPAPGSASSSIPYPG